LLERSVAPGMGPKTVTGPDKLVQTNELKAARTTIQKPVGSSRTWVVVACTAVVLAAIAFGIYKLRPRNEIKGRLPFERVEVAKLTTNGNALMAAMSPDGKYVAYITNEGGKSSLWLRQVAINSNAQLVAPREGRYLGMTFSPDGNFIYFGYASSDRNDAGQIYRLPVLGIGTEATRIDTTDGPKAISHDNKRMAFIRYDIPNRREMLVVANADGSGEQFVVTRTYPLRLSLDLLTKPAWSADDRSLSLPALSSNPASSNNIAVNYSISMFQKDLVSGAEQTIPLNPQRFDEVGRVTMLPEGNGVMLLAKAYGASFIQIWQLFRDGSVKSITNDLSDYRELSLRADAS